MRIFQIYLLELMNLMAHSYGGTYRRIKFTIEEFNEETSSVFVELKDKEDKRQKMYTMIKDGNIPSQKERSRYFKRLGKKIDEIES